jgi:uncharacterized protein (UPF0332 family)
MPREKHPPKVKHATRRRPTKLSPLSDLDRKEKAEAEFAKAIIQLGEAEGLARLGQIPNACASSAYYAMHHAARAALFAAGGVGRLGDVPNSHEHVAEHYLRLVTGAPEPLGSTAEALDRARFVREVADYDLYRNVKASEALATTVQARIMLDAIRQKWGFAA